MKSIILIVSSINGPRSIFNWSIFFSSKHRQSAIFACFRSTTNWLSFPSKSHRELGQTSGENGVFQRSFDESIISLMDTQRKREEEWQSHKCLGIVQWALKPMLWVSEPNNDLRNPNPFLLSSSPGDFLISDRLLFRIGRSQKAACKQSSFEWVIQLLSNGIRTFIGWNPLWTWIRWNSNVASRLLSKAANPSRSKCQVHQAPIAHLLCSSIISQISPIEQCSQSREKHFPCRLQINIGTSNGNLEIDDEH